MRKIGKGTWAALAASVALASYLAAYAQQATTPPKRENEMEARERATAQGLRRMGALPPEQWTEEQKAAAAAYKAARKNDLKSGLFMDLLRVPDAMEAVFKMRLYVQNKISFGDKLSQLGMLVTLREWNQKQEFGGHAVEAVRYGLNPQIVHAIAEGRYPPGMDADESLIYDFTSELLHNHNVSDPTYARMVRRFGENGVIEGVTLVGLYSMVGMTYNTVREPVPVGYTPLPDFPQLQTIPLSAYSELPPRPANFAFPPARPAAPPPSAK
jgi:4-carboxymuconolactone decarboxylase